MEFTDDWYTDGRVPSVIPSVLFLPTDFIAVTDGMSPSVKLDNVVVYRLYIYRKYYRTTLVLTIVYYPTYINIDRKSWLVNRLSLLLLFNSYTISSLVSFIFYIFITNGISKSFFQRLKLLKKLFTNIIYFLVMNR
jgi:hypothetical protein